MSWLLLGQRRDYHVFKQPRDSDCHSGDYHYFRDGSQDIGTLLGVVTLLDVVVDILLSYVLVLAEPIP